MQAATLAAPGRPSVVDDGELAVEAGLNTDRPMGLCLSGVTKGSAIKKPTSRGKSEIRAFEASMMLRDALGAALADPHVELHLAEWKD